MPGFLLLLLLAGLIWLIAIDHATSKREKPPVCFNDLPPLFSDTYNERKCSICDHQEYCEVDPDKERTEY
jgi:hypothetical protein